MTKVIQEVEKPKIPYDISLFDSMKIEFDMKLCTYVERFDDMRAYKDSSGEDWGDLKQRSWKIPYLHETIYYSTYSKQLKPKNAPIQHFDKVVILVNSKHQNPDDYFKGVTKNVVLNILEFLREKGVIQFDCLHSVYKGCFVKDLDVKKDALKSMSNRDNDLEVMGRMKKYFDGDAQDCQHFRDTKVNGFGLQANHRKRSTLSKPFEKMYDKGLELMTNSRSFYNLMSDKMQNHIALLYILRREITLKNKPFFDHFGISNRLEDLFDVSQEKWNEVFTYYYQKNYGQFKPKRPDNGKMTPTDKLHALNMFEDFQENGRNMYYIREKYERSGNKKNRTGNRQIVLFERIYHYVTQVHAKEIRDEIDEIQAWAKHMGWE